MTKAQQSQHKEWVRGSTHEAVDAEVLAELPMFSSEQILNSKITQEQMAIQHAFCSGAIWYANRYLEKGRAPKAMQARAHARQMRFSTNE